MDLERERTSRFRELKPKFVLAETARLEPSPRKMRANQNFSVGLEDVFCSTITTIRSFFRSIGMSVLFAFGRDGYTAGNVTGVLEIGRDGDVCTRLQIVVGGGLGIEMDFVSLVIDRGIQHQQSSAQIQMNDLSHKCVAGSRKRQN